MTLSLCTPCFSGLLLHQHHSYAANHSANNAPFPHLFFFSASPLHLTPINLSRFLNSARASVSESHNEISNDTHQLDQQLLLRVASAAKDADEALQMIALKSNTNGGGVSTDDCCTLISAALQRNNPQLALSVFYAMRASFDSVGGGNGPLVEGWKWSRPNAHVYTQLIQGLAASLRVSDALRVLKYICEVGVSPGEEVRFGKIVRCPSCRIAVAVAQPQQGIQVVSCAKCRYQYELVSGDIVSIQSEEIRISSCRTQHGHYSMAKGVEIPATGEEKPSCCCSLYGGANPFWYGSHPQICN